MEHTKTSAKDFFLHLGSMVALYVVASNFINLLFKIIDQAFPDMITNGYYWSQGSEISLPVATLIIVFPIFVILSRIVHKIYEQTPEKKSLGIRKWLTYITLFFAGTFLAGDLVMVLYKFLDGQDLTVAFLLKALVVFLVSGAVFGFYLQDIRDRVSASQRKIWSIVVGIVILVSIILGFSVLGSPKTQRLLRYDNQKITDLQNIQWEIINYWQINGSIPAAKPYVIDDSQTGLPYEYAKTGELSFVVCADFNLANEMKNPSNRMISEGPYWKGGLIENDDWSHPVGRYCFPRTIDPIMYPTQGRG